jgi:Tfp pilus assembly protein PilO
MIKLPKITGLLSAIAHFSKREKLVLYGAVIFVSLWLADWLVIRTFLGLTAGLDKQIQEKEAKIKTDLKILAQKQRIEIQRANYSSYLGAAITDNEEFTIILKEVETLANKSGINLVDMKPGGVKDSSSSKKYQITLNCEGSMEKIVGFMYEIETAKKLFTVEKYELTPKSKDTALVKCSMTVSSLVFP